MKTNWPEKVFINSPVRLLIQRWEMKFFKGLKDLPASARCLEIGCGRGAAIPLIKKMFEVMSANQPIEVFEKETLNSRKFMREYLTFVSNTEWNKG